jgi:hypothetical protein
VIRHLAAAIGGAIAIALLAAGCGTRDLAVVVTGQGMLYVRDACSVNNSNSTCIIEGNPLIGSTTLSTPLQARLVLNDASGTVRASSACFELLPNSSTDDKTWANAMATQLNQELAGAFPGGLTYPGLKDPSEVSLILAIYQPDPMTMPMAAPCELDALIACAGFEQPLSGGAYDIACASCQRGSTVAQAAHCPSTADTCFLQECEKLLMTMP